MTPNVMTLELLASYVDVDDLVGVRPSGRWGRASLITRRSDGHSIASWFDSHGADERIKIVSAALLEAVPWQPLTRVRIPKRAGSPETRSIDMPIIVDAARLYRLHDWLAKHAEQVLTKVAVGFRQGVQMHQTILNAHHRMKSQPFAAVVDVAGFYDHLPWSVIDSVIDELPADERVQDLLRALVRVEIVERRSGRRVERAMGIAQGLSVSPAFANLALNEFDRHVAHVLSKLGALLRRFCDDILLLGPSRDALQRALDIVTDRLAKLGLSVRPGTGTIVDTRIERVTWLGISFGPAGLDVPQRALDRKVLQLQSKLDQGILDPLGIDDRLFALYDYYRRVVGPGRSQELTSSIRERLVITNRSPQRKEDLEILRTLIDDCHHRGPSPSGEHPRGQPDGLDDQRGDQTDRDDREADPGRHL